VNRALAFARAAWRDLHHEGDPARAAIGFARAVALDPAQPSFWNGYAIALAQSHSLDEAVEACKTSLRLAPTDVAVWCILGEIHYDRGDLKSAAEAFARCFALDPRARHPSGLRARALVRRIDKMLKKR
jgi:cytochrome c-type biogenesis protein CcmH/NrfG